MDALCLRQLLLSCVALGYTTIPHCCTTPHYTQLAVRTLATLDTGRPRVEVRADLVWVCGTDLHALCLRLLVCCTAA